MEATSPTHVGGLAVDGSEREARLMQFVKGEAELVCEAIDVEKLCADCVDKAVFSLLDDKYGPQPTDLLHKALKGFFYELNIHQGESYQQFMARFYHTDRLLVEQEVKLTEKVLLFMLLKKMKLDATSEAMVLTATKGSMKQLDVQEAFKNIFPEGKVTENQDAADDEDGDFQEALEAVVEDLQAQGSADDEEILEAFESYADVRRKMLEKKKSRGFVETERHREWEAGTAESQDEVPLVQAHRSLATGVPVEPCENGKIGDVKCFQQCREDERGPHHGDEPGPAWRRLCGRAGRDQGSTQQVRCEAD